MKLALAGVFKEHKENKLLLEKMTAENRKFDGEILEALLEAENKGLDGRRISQKMSALRADILAAQNQGISARSYFGKSAQDLSSEMISEMPNKSQTLGQNSYATISAVVFALLYFVVILDGKLSLKNLILLLVLFVIPYLISFVIDNFSYKIWPNKTGKQRRNMKTWLINGILLLFLLVILILKYFKLNI